MYTCPPNLTHSFLTVYKIITFKVDKKDFFAYDQEVQQSFGGPKNHFFGYIWNESLWIPIHKWVRYISTKSHIHGICGTLQKISFSGRGYAEIHIQRPFFEYKKYI
jgi:hypothetical protein